MKDNVMYILYYKELYIVKESLTKNRTHQKYRGKQIAMCEKKEPLENMIAKSRYPERYYIEEQPHGADKNYCPSCGAEMDGGDSNA